MIKLNIYAADGKTINRTATSEPFDLSFGAIRKLMSLLKIEKLNDTASILNIINNAWEEIIKILSEAFPDITDDEWDCIKLNELVPAVIGIAKEALTGVNSLPREKN